jgi:hypothetical protein
MKFFSSFAFIATLAGAAMAVEVPIKIDDIVDVIPVEVQRVTACTTRYGRTLGNNPKKEDMDKLNACKLLVIPGMTAAIQVAGKDKAAAFFKAVIEAMKAAKGPLTAASFDSVKSNPDFKDLKLAANTWESIATGAVGIVSEGQDYTHNHESAARFALLSEEKIKQMYEAIVNMAKVCANQKDGKQSDECKKAMAALDELLATSAMQNAAISGMLVAVFAALTLFMA